MAISSCVSGRILNFFAQQDVMIASKVSHENNHEPSLPYAYRNTYGRCSVRTPSPSANSPNPICTLRDEALGDISVIW